MANTVNKILEELMHLSSHIQEEELEDICDQLMEAHHKKHSIFLAGAGRSGCVVKAFTNRLMHLGFHCFVVGDVTTPPIHKDDILFILSGSGKTSSLVEMAKKTKGYGASILSITLQKEGDIAKMAKAYIVLPGTTRLQNKVLFESIQPIGSSFEQLSWITCDALILLLKQKLGLKNEDLIKNHANLE